MTHSGGGDDVWLFGLCLVDVAGRLLIKQQSAIF